MLDNKEIITNDKSHLESEFEISAKKAEVLKLHSLLDEILKRKYILEAAKLYGLGQVEIDALRAHLEGRFKNEFIVRRTEFLFRLYDVFKSTKYNEKIDTDENGIINLNDYSFEISTRRLADSKIGRSWIISSNLEAFLITNSPNYSSQIKSKFLKISDKNNYLLPQIAKQMGIDATVYYKGEYTDESGALSTFHLTKNFLGDEENLIQGNSIVKDNPNKKRVDFEALLETTDKYVKKYYKKHKLPAKDMEKARTDIRQGLIKQAIFNKMVFNENESNEKWGLIICKDKKLRLAPLFSYDFCAGVELTQKSHHRVIDGNREDIETFMLEFGKEKWFRDWIRDFAVRLDFDKAVKDMERKTGICLSDEETEYYRFLINKMHSKIVSVYDLNYDQNLVNQNKKEKLGDKLKRLKDTVSDKVEDIKAFINPPKDDEGR